MAACSYGDPEVRPTGIKVPVQGIDYTEIRCPSSFSNESGGRFLNPQISNYPFHASNLTETILIDFLRAFSGLVNENMYGRNQLDSQFHRSQSYGPGVGVTVTYCKIKEKIPKSTSFREVFKAFYWQC